MRCRIFRISVMALFVLGLTLMFVVRPVWADTFGGGHVFAAVNNGLVYHYDAAGNYLETLDCGYGGFTTGMAFDGAGNLYVTEFSNAYITVFSGPDDPHTILQRIYTGTLGDRSPESIVFDDAGNFYVGHATGNCDIHKYDSAGNLLDTYDVVTENVGSDWIELAADQHTIFYTSEGKKVMRYDVNTKMQMADFATGLPGTKAFALRILSDGSVLVADTESIVRLDGSGSVFQTYDVTGENTWFSLNLDPDGTSFWSGNYGTDKFYKFDIASGTMLLSVDTGLGGGNLYGLVVSGEITIARANIWSSDPLGAAQDLFMQGEKVYATGSSFQADESVRIYVVPNGGPYTAAAALSSTAATADSTGNLGPKKIFGAYVSGEHDIWVDRDADGELDTDTEPVDTIGSSYGFQITGVGVIPEVPFGTVVASAVMIIALGAYFAIPKFHKRQISISL